MENPHERYGHLSQSPCLRTHAPSTTTHTHQTIEYSPPRPSVDQVIPAASLAHVHEPCWAPHIRFSLFFSFHSSLKSPKDTAR